VDGEVRFDDEVSWPFQLVNRNKNSLAVDLTKQDCKDIVHNIINHADIFVSNYETSSLHKLEMDYETIKQINPGIIYGILTGYGTTGPDKNKRGFDFSAGWARPGMQYLIGEQGSNPPPQRGGMMDTATAGYIVAGLMAALVHKEKTGNGQKLEFSLFHTGVWILGSDIQAALVGQPLPRQHNRKRVFNPLFNSYQTRDEQWIWLAMLQSDASWSDFCQALSILELENDPRFNTMESRAYNCEKLVCIIEKRIISKDLVEWEKIFTNHDCIYERIQSPTEVVNDEQAIANNYFADVIMNNGLAGKLISTPVKFIENPATIKSSAPELGQNTESILLGLGYSWADIAQLKEQGIIL